MIFLILLLLLTSHAFSFYHCFFDAGERYKVDPVLLIAIAKSESGFNPRAINTNKNGTKDYGIMQINSYWLERYKIPKEWIFEPCYNIHFGAMVLRKCLDQSPNIAVAVDCYNKGNKAKGYGAYVERVFRNYKKYYTMLK
ncbi:MAG: lytic transglycosylase domain-containing protein [Aquificota bacterium]|jgi:soluble lytic murein transglycosylase-like protein|nr:lytic transglycosylase domain-containing protein [Aquificaceae bacterium]MDM7267014.1 lytic transglycosylase domain-containing protein [Aquificaceae bacterium]QWK13682.1 MAG: lytic transglycosylase domain-containing protein [Aquificota bacterium]HAV40235.1 lytic transglycosylase [Aquificaceae bacterium]